MDKYVYLGRFSPLHRGHQQVIDKLILQFGLKNIIVMIGSSNKINGKTPYTYSYRKKILKAIYPKIKIIPVPDFYNDTKWLNYIKDLEIKLNSKFIFFGGSMEDLQLLNTVFETRVLVDRFKEGLNISGTKVREAIVQSDVKYLKKSLDPYTFNLLVSKASYFVYIIRTSKNTLYIGQTSNLKKRIKEHKLKSSKSAKYLKYFDSFELVYSEIHSTKSSALKREIELKKWPKSKKEAMINNAFNNPHNIRTS